MHRTPSALDPRSTVNSSSYSYKRWIDPARRCTNAINRSMGSCPSMSQSRDGANSRGRIEGRERQARGECGENTPVCEVERPDCTRYVNPDSKSDSRDARLSPRIQRMGQESTRRKDSPRLLHVKVTVK